MAFVTGALLIDAPASALNNLGGIPGERDENTVGVKLIRTAQGAYPYVSAQAFRYWLRETVGQTHPEWKAAPIYREKKVAYTDANPITWWDDDLLGYMRAPSAKTDAVKAREEDASRANETPTSDTVTRVSPFRVSTLVSIAPVTPTEDFGVMARHEGNPVPHVHQFYRAALQGLFSLDLHACGTFSYRQRTGYRNLDEVRTKLAIEQGLEHLEQEKSYRLPVEERIRRVSTLLDALATIEGGAKQALHYTDVSPVVVMVAITKGGNHIFGHVIGANSRGLPTVNLDALAEVFSVFAGEILSPIYVGWSKGFLDDERQRLQAFLADQTAVKGTVVHPREALKSLVSDLQAGQHRVWME